MLNAMLAMLLFMLACLVQMTHGSLSLDSVILPQKLGHVVQDTALLAIATNASVSNRTDTQSSSADLYACRPWNGDALRRYATVSDPSEHTTTHDPHRSVLVHLFEWKFNEIGRECEEFLSLKGFAGVQVSPITEYVIVEGGAWWDRYQPISYKIAGRSGNQADFEDMVVRCNAAGVRVYVDVVFNHMTGNENGVYGAAGSVADAVQLRYPAVPFEPEHFHRPVCRIRSYQRAEEIRNCELLGLHDLNQTCEHVRAKIVQFLNHLIFLGVAGFRIDAAKHMWPTDLHVIYSRLNNLNTAHGFPASTRPFIYQEVIDLGGEGVSIHEYTPLAAVTEFKYSAEIGRVFGGENLLKWMRNWGTDWGFVHSGDALVFIDNHDNQRGIASGNNRILTHKDPKQYRMANAFMLAHPFGTPRVMSSYEFANANAGPPALGPAPSTDGLCINSWVCEHRWPQISNMVTFRNAVGDVAIQNWWDNGAQQIAFSRGDRGFVAFTLEGDLRRTLHTGLPPGVYCDIISGSSTARGCTGKTIIVNEDGMAYIELGIHEFDGVLAIHVEAKQCSAELDEAVTSLFLTY